jgi:hypothetical protein
VTTSDTMSAADFNAMQASAKRSKYGNRKVERDGYKFDSIAEANHYVDLKLRLDAGDITDLELQPVFPLVVNGVIVAQYRADFSYVDADGVRHVEDVKGVRTSTYRLKAKMVRAIYGIEIEEVSA